MSFKLVLHVLFTILLTLGVQAQSKYPLAVITEETFFFLICALGTMRCYNCNEDDAACADPVNVANLPSVTCSETSSSAPRSISDPPEQTIRYKIDKIYAEDVNQSGRSASTSNITFQCIKVVVAGGKTIKVFISHEMED